MTRVILAILGTLAIFGCSNSYDPPAHPENISGRAVWRGGFDGGYWIHCEPTNGNLSCEFYAENGDLDFQQEFELCQVGEPSEIFGDIHVSDGGASVTQNGFRFYPIGPRTIFSQGQVNQELTEKAVEEFEHGSRADCARSVVVAPLNGDPSD